ncbi:nephronectin [Neoarius graeffei]|uniref:nephronectin n=1 Tax=Neoarius graeffei TaxID=443677 RepID=UPI00298D334B|nr:nephronectin [Neoarius graeffei]
MEEEIPGLLLLLLLLSRACVPEQVLHRPAVLETSTNGICHYGNRVDCCWGWTRESWGQCRPVCELGCKHGKCVGPDQCRCYQGYTGKTCNQDVNECGLKPRPCKHRCMNMVGSYKCFCLTGYMMTYDGTCRNARTCAMANCQYGCAVMKGEVICQCPSPGLRLGVDRRTCVDIDECAMGVAKCPRFRTCVNTFGSYICRCHKGFELRYINGKYHCIDKNNPCYEKPDSKKCRCKPGTRGWSYDCKFVITVTVDPARPFTKPRPTTKITTATFTSTTSQQTTTKKPAATTITMTTTISPTTTTTVRTTTSPTTTTMTPTMPTTVPTSAEPTTVASTIATCVPATTAPTTVATTMPTMVATTMPTTAAMRTMSTTVAVTTIAKTVAMTTMPAITTMATTTTLPTAMHLITTMLDNHIWEITQRPRGDVHIPRNPEQNMFELDFDDIELGNTADFAHDDPAAGSLSCSFDQGLCSWMTDWDGDLCWETVDDPHGGRYLAVPEPKTGRSFRGARLTIPLAPPTIPTWKRNDFCLVFRHRLQGLLIGSLQVFVKKGQGYSPAIWTRTSGQGWRHTQITLWGQGIESVVFKGERRKGRSGEIALDNVSIHRGECSNRG